MLIEHKTRGHQSQYAFLFVLPFHKFVLPFHKKSPGFPRLGVFQIVERFFTRKLLARANSAGESAVINTVIRVP